MDPCFTIFRPLPPAGRCVEKWSGEKKGKKKKGKKSTSSSFPFLYYLHGGLGEEKGEGKKGKKKKKKKREKLSFFLLFICRSAF